MDRLRTEVARQLDFVAKGEGTVKFLRGGYGCGKSFSARLAILDAQEKKFATSFVVVSENDLHLERFDDVYRKIVTELSTSACPRGALADVIDRWIARVEEALVAGGVSEDAEDFDERVEKRLGEELESFTRQAVPADFVRALQGFFKLKQAGKNGEAGAILSWLQGSSNVSAAAKKAAGLKGDIEGRDALSYLMGILAVVKAAGYQGMVVVIDEAETILRMRADSRAKSLNAIRQILDVAKDFPGLLWVFTGTPEFFDTRRGVQGLQPLHDRIQFRQHGGMASARQPQLELKPFDRARLKEVALKLRAIYPAEDATRLERAVSPELIDALVEQVTQGFNGDVGVVPRQFLRKLVDILDLVREEPAFDVSKAVEFKAKDLTPAEERVAKKQPPFDPEPEDEKGYESI